MKKSERHKGLHSPGLNVPNTSSDLAARISNFLDKHHVVSLATCSSGRPHAANLFYARNGLSLLWVSDPASRHSIELEANPRVAATVAPDYRDFDEICGLQISGQAHRVSDASERRHARGLLEARYPFLNRLSDGPPALRDAYAHAEVYRLDPERLVMTDNSRGFAHKDTLDLGPNKRRGSARC